MADLIGQSIGNYRIEALLGTGGMGQVFRGQHRHLERRAAIKVMHAHLAVDAGFQERFLREARAAAALNHRNVVQIYDFGEQDGRFFLVMELMEDGSLATLLEAAKQGAAHVDLRLALNTARQAAEGLAYAHANGMVHRDIKPDNLLIERDATPGGTHVITKVCDFGLARLTESTMLTGTGMLMGTPAYMSPEQAQGLPLDGRSDQYALGVVLYELVTGQRLFETRTATDALFKHVYTQPTPPRLSRPELPEAVDAIILRCLAKKPEQRFARTDDLAKALHDALTALDRQPTRSEPVHVRESADPARLQLVGMQLSRFVVETSLGVGSIAWVYRGSHVRLGQPVILKVLRPEFARDQPFVRRLIQETKLAARLRHPNIAEILDAGTAAGHLFIATEYVEGRPLREILDERRLNLAETVGYVRQLGAALDYAHENGVLHHDLRPDNIMIRADGTLVLVDFGLAKAAEELSLASGGVVTSVSAEYRAPEQLTGRPSSTRTDMYALGCLTYAMLAGEPPFSGSSFPSLVDAHVHGVPQPVHLRVSGLPQEVSAVVARSLAKSPENRFASAGAFAAALEAAIPALSPSIVPTGQTPTGTTPAASLQATGTIGTRSTR
jgi:serine/threonine protein kinase